MENRKTIREQLDLSSALQVIAQVYEEISIAQIKHIRDSVLNNRKFLDDLLDLINDVKSAHNDVIELMKKEHKNKTQQKEKEAEKTLCVLISANTKLYGDIIQHVFEVFTKAIDEPNTDVMIIGRFGRELYRERHIKKPYSYFEIPDNKVLPQDLKPIIFNMVKYKKVVVYHGQFQNIIMQKPAISTIAGHLMSDPDVASSHPVTKSTHQYLFEPSLKEIVTFFETQFTTTLFYQSIHESELARNASRVKAMEESLDNIRHNEKKLRAVQRLLRKREDNKKQLERMSSASLW